MKDFDLKRLKELNNVEFDVKDINFNDKNPYLGVKSFPLKSEEGNVLLTDIIDKYIENYEIDAIKDLSDEITMAIDVASDVRTDFVVNSNVTSFSFSGSDYIFLDWVYESYSYSIVELVRILNVYKHLDYFVWDRNMIEDLYDPRLEILAFHNGFIDKIKSKEERLSICDYYDSLNSDKLKNEFIKKIEFQNCKRLLNKCYGDINVKNEWKIY